jgi:1,4-alpha-glucan branching enzyme
MPGYTISMGQQYSLYEINTRVWLRELSHTLGRRATLDDIEDRILNKLAEKGFDWIYLLSVWKTGDVGRQISRTHSEWQKEFRNSLPDLSPDDICGSGFAITAYELNEDFGEPGSLLRLRDRLHKRGMRLMLDFVPNHTAIDHPWITQHPQYYVYGTEELLRSQPQNYTRTDNNSSSGSIIAHGKDPYFDGWPDTAQLNYGNAELQNVLRETLIDIATKCDGVRCDMAMLVLPEVFKQTWGIEISPFWAEAINEVRAKSGAFTFMAEVYWDMEFRLQQDGFDYTYDKRLYDRLHAGSATPVREHLLADLSYQNHSARFLENHDEPRAATTFPFAEHQAAAIITYLCPGLRFFHQGQLDGWKRKLSVHLCRRTKEPVDPQIKEFYLHLLEIIKLQVVRSGQWQLLQCQPAWDGNPTANDFIAFAWTNTEANRVTMIAVNYSDHQSQCYVTMPEHWRTSSDTTTFRDLTSDAVYLRQQEALKSRGLYLDLHAWGYHVFTVEGEYVTHNSTDGISATESAART